MTTARRRGLNLGDAMILVAATAVGCSQVDWNLLNTRISWVHRHASFSYVTARWAFNMVVYPSWLTWTFAVLAIELRPPRPAFRRLARRPGVIASLLVSLFAPIFLAQSILNVNWRGINVRPWHLGMPIPSTVLCLLPYPSALLVIGAWLTLAVGRRWKAEPSFIDRSGRLLGFGWIAFFLADQIENLIGF
jgi:hypothetical protein